MSADLLARFSTRADLHQSPMHADLMVSIGWQIVGEPGSQLFVRPLGPFSVAKIQRTGTLDLGWLKQMQKKYRTLLTYIEPGLTPMPDLPGFKVEPFAHSATSLIDLRGDSRKILASFSQKTRYNITHSQKQNQLKLSTTSLSSLSQEELNSFISLHEFWTEDRHVVGHPTPHLRQIFRSYKHQGDLHVAYKGLTLVGALLVLYHDSVATYYTAYATAAGHKSYAPTLLTWQSIQQAQTRGCDIFDFGGIYDPRYPKLYKKWQGFTKFKSGFRPTVVSYPGTTLQIGW